LAMEGEAENVLLALHMANIDGATDWLQTTADGTLAPRKVDGKHVTASLMGSEGADELVKALATAFNGYRTEAEKAADKEAKAKAAPLATRDFATLPVADVALHLFRILAGRIDESTEESLVETTDDCAAIVTALDELITTVAEGSKTLADILNPKADTPTDEGAAEDDADATA